MANTTVKPIGDYFSSNNLDYRWWVGSDGNIWANVEGKGVSNLGKATQVAQNRAVMQGLDASKEISDPNKPASEAANPTGGVYDTISARGGSSSTSAANTALNNRMIGIYDRQIGDINNNIGSLDTQLANNLAALKGEYNQYKNEQQSAYNANKNDYENSTKQNQQNLQTNRNEITNRASKGLRGLLRVLGSMGASGSSVARYEAPKMVMDQANQEYDNAGKTYAQNQSNLDTDWGNYQNDFENDKKKLEDWYNGQEKAKRQEIEERKQSLLTDLISAYGNRAQYGGDYGNNVSDIYNRIAESRNKVVDLGKYTPANYTGMTSVYKSPDLASYNANDMNLSTSVAESNTSAASPLLTALRGLNKKKISNPYSNIVEE